MAVQLYDYQQEAITKMKNGSILCGGVGSGKSRTSLAYYFTKECDGQLNPFSAPSERPHLYIITTARKRDTKEWEGECVPFLIDDAIIDSWNNISKYENVEDAFFIFDEQRVVGKGAWVKSFIKITKHNRWILLSATPGDTWSDYIPVFIANGFYKNRTEFLKRHAVYSRYAKFPKIDHYVECGRLIKFRRDILVNMEYTKPTVSHNEDVIVGYDTEMFKMVTKNRWNPYTQEPIKDISQLCSLMRKVVNSSPDRIAEVKRLIDVNGKSIVFYNYDYELDILRQVSDELCITKAEWNGHKHQPLPTDDRWVYLVQYTAGAEGWNCITTNVIIFYSQNYSYKSMIQAAGRIDRLNTPFSDLYYYHLRSTSSIDRAIYSTLKRKENFNESNFVKKIGASHETTTAML